MKETYSIDNHQIRRQPLGMPVLQYVRQKRPMQLTKDGFEQKETHEGKVFD